jgi:hypothetical protein
MSGEMTSMRRSEGLRRWTIRLGTVAGIGLVAAAAYCALQTTPFHCPQSTPTRRLACDPPPPAHPHLGLALALAVSGILVLAGTPIVAMVWKQSDV